MGLNGILVFIFVLCMAFVSPSHSTTAESNTEGIHTSQDSDTKNVYCKCENGYCELNHADQIVCMCPVEYGPVSPTKCKRCDCGRGANCTFDWGLFRDTKYCLCKRGYKDVEGRCRGDCSGTPCRNGGICRIKGYDIVCDCKKPYYGELCQLHPCDLYICSNGGRCLILGNETKCSCKAPFSGDHCEIDPCDNNPCLRGGSCSIEGGMVKCHCKIPYTGDFCEKNATLSISSPITKSLIIITSVSVGFLVMCFCVICCRCFRRNRENKTVIRRTVQPPSTCQNFNTQYQAFEYQHMSQFPPPPPPYTEQVQNPTTNIEIAPPTAPPMYERY